MNPDLPIATAAAGEPALPSGRTRWSRRRMLGALAVGGGALARPAAAQPAGPGGSPVPALVSELVPRARLAGEGRLRWFGFHVYDARLFVGAPGLEAERYTNGAFALELRYARSLLGQEIAKTSTTEIARLGFGTAAQHDSWFASMRGLFPDVGPGDRLTGVNRPQEPVIFLRNDRRLGQVEDRAFAQAFFAIWFDPRTAAPDLRRALLQQAGPESAPLGERR